ncbi:Nitroreductase [Syntrophus gentianae]|uniref:Nitroreductase n=1 Tax=Syntrophus gentianae TaxID=43775 RepID=A0A1H7YVL7_9BACT|nr:nitroreductase family protein [Syntrophus gentianae]SEM49975.1 Nitroreductase [Syntrophus gentianae]
MSNIFEVDPQKCRRSGICATSCPMKIITFREEDGLPVWIEGAEQLCLHCERCVSTCPSQAITLKVQKLTDEDLTRNNLLQIDPRKCKQDYLCLAACPFKLITVNRETKLPFPIDKAELQCILCGHCVSVCPYGALSIKTLKPGVPRIDATGLLIAGPLSLETIRPEECSPFDRKHLPPEEQVKHLLTGRRSIRVYRKKPVDRESLADILDTARYAPTAMNSQPVNWLVIEDAQEVKRLTGLAIDWMRSVIKTDLILAQQLHIQRLVAAWESGEDRICRGAPHLIVAHADGANARSSSSCTIALTYLEIAAFSKGLGACWAGYFSRAANLYPPLKEALRLPEGHQVFGAMMVGYPQLRYHLIPPRKKGTVTWR